MKKQVVLKIHGRVQGVFFRDSSCKKGRELNLSGTVQNELDETVIIVAEGEEEKLKELLVWCQDGPEHAEVEKVEVNWLEPTGQFDSFTIK